MSYLIFEYIRNLLEAEEIDAEKANTDEAMGNSISSITELTGVHGNTLGIAIGVSLGVLVTVGAVQFYYNRQLKKKIKALMAVNPDAQVYHKRPMQNQFGYRNFAFGHNPIPINNNQANPVGVPAVGGVPAEAPGGVPAV